MVTVKNIKQWLSDFPDDMPVEAVDFKTNKVILCDLMVTWESQDGTEISTMGIE